MERPKGGPPVGRFVAAGPIRMHVLEYGNPKGEAVVFLHGSGPGNSAWANFRQNINAFMHEGYHVILLDMIGFGYTDKPVDLGDYTLDLFVDTVLAGLDSLKVKSAHFVGNSLGGGVALKIALDHPSRVKKLILMGPGCLEEQAEYWPMPGIKAMMAINAAGVTKETQAKVLRLFPFDPDVVKPDLLEMRWVVAQTQPKEVLTTMKTPALGSRLSELSCPVLTFWGEQDAFMPPQGKVACAEVGELVEVENCGHWVMVERPKLFDRKSLAFLAA